MMSERESGPGRRPFAATLLYPSEVVPNLQRLEAQLGAAGLFGTSVSPIDADGSFVIRHPEPLRIEEGEAVASICVTRALAVPFEPSAFRQSWAWGWRQASTAAEPARFALTVGELTSLAMPVAERAHFLLESVKALSEEHAPLAISWPMLERFDEPLAFMEAETGPLQLVNVRLFVLVSPDAVRTFVMDTLGLSALGMLDLQLHFRGLEPERMATYLYSLADELLAEGPAEGLHSACPIDDGSEVLGATGVPWMSRYEMSIMEPRRGVVDLTPEASFSAR